MIPIKDKKIVVVIVGAVDIVSFSFFPASMRKNEDGLCQKPVGSLSFLCG